MFWCGFFEGVVFFIKKIEKKEYYNYESNDVVFNEVIFISKVVFKSFALLRNINKIIW